jgi:hypothetical protein
MNEYSFKVTVVACVRVLATSERYAHEVVSAALDSLSTGEIRLANEADFAGKDAVIKDITFSVDEGSVAIADAGSTFN